jgi:Bifunctional DNA primase/polymerase, N-terminal
MHLDSSVYISGYRQLSELEVGFYPVHSDKSPAVHGRLNRVATTDPIKIRYWAENLHHRSFAARILRHSHLLVIDTENPFKRPGIPGPDGEVFLGSLLEDCDTTLPACPTVQTASGGFHRYLLVPKMFPVQSRIALWPGIDILACGSSVILPGSRTEHGEYRAVRSFDDCPIPEAPRAFVKLIRNVQKGSTRSSRVPVTASTLFAEANSSEVSARQWWLLFKNRVFRSFWKRQGKAGDATDSAYEYHIAKACFCCGLNVRQSEAVILNWRRKHGLNRDSRQLRTGILPKAWAEVEPWVERWHAERLATNEAKRAAKTSSLILAFLRNVDEPQEPAAVAAGLAMPRERAKKAMQRMAEAGTVVRTRKGYAVPVEVGTF